MSSVPDQPSWRLKLVRAYKHLVEVEEGIRAYSERHPYEMRWEGKRHRKSGQWRYKFRITEKPSQWIAIVLGDVVHNIRSALDHLAVGIAPKRRKYQAGFPIFDQDIWAVDSAGDFLVDDDEGRERFEQQVRGMPAEAVAIIKELQPYATWTRDPTALRIFIYDLVNGEKQYRLDWPETHILALLNRLDNADKHRNLIAIPTGLMNAVCRFVDQQGNVSSVNLPQTEIIGACMDGAQFDLDPPPNTEVQMQIRGTVIVAVDAGPKQGYTHATKILGGILRRVGGVVFDALEPFARK